MENGQRDAGGWFRLDNEVIDRYGKEIGCIGVALLALLTRMADSEGRCFPSLATIEDRLGCSRSGSKTYLRKLQTAGLIEIERRRSTCGDPDSNAYLVHSIARGVGFQETYLGHQKTEGRSPENRGVGFQEAPKKTHVEQDPIKEEIPLPPAREEASLLGSWRISEVTSTDEAEHLTARQTAAPGRDRISRSLLGKRKLAAVFFYLGRQPFDREVREAFGVFESFPGVTDDQIDAAVKEARDYCAREQGGNPRTFRPLVIALTDVTNPVQEHSNGHSRSGHAAGLHAGAFGRGNPAADRRSTGAGRYGPGIRMGSDPEEERRAASRERRVQEFAALSRRSDDFTDLAAVNAEIDALLAD